MLILFDAAYILIYGLYYTTKGTYYSISYLWNWTSGQKHIEYSELDELRSAVEYLSNRIPQKDEGDYVILGD